LTAAKLPETTGMKLGMLRICYPDLAEREKRKTAILRFSSFINRLRD